MAQLVGVKSDSEGLYNHDHKSVYSIASLDFGELVPVRKKDLVPRHRISHFKGRGFLRLAPQVFPAYGRCTFNSAAFACSESQIIESAQAFHDGKLVYKGKGFNLPYAYFSSMTKMFTSRSGVIGTSSADLDDNSHLCVLVKHTDYPSQGWFDVTETPGPSTTYSPINEDEYTFMAPYVYSESGGVQNVLYGFWRLTRFGCRYYKILKGCGFDFPSFGNEVSTTFTNVDTLYDKYAKTPFNLMPFLAYLHIYQDYFLNPNMYATSLFVQYLHNIHDLEPIVDSTTLANWYIPSSGAISADLIHFFLTNIRVPHHRGLYLNSWNSPLSPLGDSPTSQSSFPDSDSIIGPLLPEVSSSYQESVQLPAGNNNPALTMVAPGGTPVMRYLTVFGQRFLNNVYQWGRRNGLFGSKYWEQFWSRFGVKPNDFNSQYSSKLFDSSQDIDFSAVMSNADTGNAGKTLGDYAGFGIGSLNFDFNYKSSDYGYIFVLSWLQPIPILLHGVDPAGLRRTYLDYWNGLWDGKTLRAIPMMELSYAKRGDLIPTINGDRKIFGYCNIYDEMRHERDIVLGDFVTSPLAKNFLFCRDIGFWRSRGVNKVAPQSNQLHYLPVPLFESDLSDVFQMSYKNGDRFYLQFTFDIIEKSPVKSDSAALDLNGEGDQLMEIGGTQVS